jgi:putative tricarboxylic transport membrane protein
MPGAGLAAVAALALYGTRTLSYGTAAHMGPGFVPTILAALLFILGLAVAAEGFWQRPIGGEE